MQAPHRVTWTKDWAQVAAILLMAWMFTAWETTAGRIKATAHGQRGETV